MARRVSVRDARRVREIEHRVAAGAELHALVLAGKKAAAPEAREQRLVDVVAACPARS